MNGIDNPRDGSVQRIGWCELYFKLWCEELNISHNLKRYNSQDLRRYFIEERIFLLISSSFVQCKTKAITSYGGLMER